MGLSRDRQGYALGQFGPLDCIPNDDTCSRAQLGPRTGLHHLLDGLVHTGPGHQLLVLLAATEVLRIFDGFIRPLGPVQRDIGQTEKS